MRTTLRGLRANLGPALYFGLALGALPACEVHFDTAPPATPAAAQTAPPPPATTAAAPARPAKVIPLHVRGSGAQATAASDPATTTTPAVAACLDATSAAVESCNLHGGPRPELRFDHDEPATVRRRPGQLQPEGRRGRRSLHARADGRPTMRPVASGQLREERARSIVRRRVGGSAVRDRGIGVQVQRGRLLDPAFGAQRARQAAGRSVRRAGMRGRPHRLHPVAPLSSSAVAKAAITP